jgi:hypothetical protein
MTTLASQVTFAVGRGTRTTVARPLTEEEHATVNEQLRKLSSKKSMIEFLVRRGWTDQQISLKVRYDDDKIDPVSGKVYHKAGDPLRVQHVYNTRTSMKS